MKSEHGKHGDPRHHATDIVALKARVAELEAEVERLTAERDAANAQATSMSHRVDL